MSVWAWYLWSPLGSLHAFVAGAGDFLGGFDGSASNRFARGGTISASQNLSCLPLT
jgi:hypothetical protein